MESSIRIPLPVRGNMVDNVDEVQSRDLPVDMIMLIIVVALALFGLVMVYSSSAILAQNGFKNQYYFLMKQTLWVSIGITLMILALGFDYRRYKSKGFIITFVIVTLSLLCIVFLFSKINNAHRWIRYGQLSFQPSEVGKLALIAFLAYFLELKSRKLDDFIHTYGFSLLISCAFIGLVAREPDLGTAMSLAVIFIALIYAVGMKMRRVILTVLLMLAGTSKLLFSVSWRRQRLLDFMDPFQNPTTTGFQMVQSLYAVGSGGITGAGFAQGKQKLFFLPAPHTDFIFAVVGEELGLIGTIILVVLFSLFAWRGIRAAKRAPDLFGQLLAIGITVMITVQALFNMSVVICLVPTKGIPLPFVSYGGSSVAIGLLAAGVLLNISKHASERWRR